MSIKGKGVHLSDASKTLRQRFMALRGKPDSNGCMNWIGSLTGSGYGKIYFNHLWGRSKQIAAHRVAWVLDKGDLEPLDLVCHKCDNKLCVNPEHLFIGTPADNVRDMVQKDRHFGAQWRATKLGEIDRVRDLKSAGVLQRDIARYLGISRTSVSYILSNRYRYARLLTT
jgi:HNH endonuclease